LCVCLYLICGHSNSPYAIDAILPC
jgi:hypothetical protein